MMNQLPAIAIGGATGAIFRYLVSTGVYSLFGREFPYGTLAVNVLGSLLMGFLFVLLVERMDMTPVIRAAILIGFLGSFTTFSTFSMETLTLLENREHLKAFMNVFMSMSLCISATWFGLIIGRQI